MRLLIINGPNLNLLGKREPGIYGNRSFENFLEEIKSLYDSCELGYFQSNVEGEIINEIQKNGFYTEGGFDGIVINPGGYSHTSVAIADAIASIELPVVEVHISNIHSREPERHHSLTGKSCKGIITGFGLDSYRLAIDYFKEYYKK